MLLWWNRYTRQTLRKMSTKIEISCVNGVKFGERFTANPEPSLQPQEGVET
jgi:hypothetical protein